MAKVASPNRRTSRFLVVAAFALFVAFFVITHVVTMRQASAARVQTELVQKMFTSIELVSKMRRDINHERILGHLHIFEKDPRNMARLEGEIQAVQSDYSATAQTFEPLASFLPDEGPAWLKLKSDVSAARSTLERSLGLSRENADAQAWPALVALYSAIDDDLNALQQINHDKADEAVVTAKDLQRSSTTLVTVRTIVGVALAIAVGMFLSRRIGRREEEAVRRHAALQASNQELEAFAGRVAHDLRGPLTAAGVAASRLGEGLSEQQRATTTILRRSLTRIDLILDDLLALSRLGANVVEGSSDPTNVVTKLREDLAFAPAGENVELTVDLQPARVGCGEGLLRQVIWNLVDNAMKYRRAEGLAKIDLRGRIVDKNYELSVRDNGQGMSREGMRQAFEPFYREHRAPGTGLGLTIVKRLIDASGGTVAIDSEPGKGTTILIRLPLAESAAAEPAPDAIHRSRAPA